MKDYIEIGDAVSQSGVGAGVITGITDAGYPQVNRVAVAWLVCPDGRVFNPHNASIPEPDSIVSAVNLS